MSEKVKATAMDVTTWQPPPCAAQVHAYFAGEPLRLGAGTHLLAHSALIEDRRGLDGDALTVNCRAATLRRSEGRRGGRRIFFQLLLLRAVDMVCAFNRKAIRS
jgi:hypothetical protein